MPKNTAVIQGEVSWTYQELANRAGILADRLGTQRAVPGEVVAVSGPICCEVIAGMVGVLLAGLLPVGHLPVEINISFLRFKRHKHSLMNYNN